jgi:predicted TIM-barrel fold metal-dependent hydrolase
MMLSGASMAALPQAARAQAQQTAAAPPAAGTEPVGPEQILLKDYNPVSIYRIPKTEIAKAKYPVIDAHWHGEWANTPERLAEMVRIMDATGVEKVVTFQRTGVPERFAELSKAFAKYPDRFYLWCGWDLSGFDQPGFAANAIKQLDECHRLGALGIGEIIDKGRGFMGGGGGRGGGGRGGRGGGRGAAAGANAANPAPRPPGMHIDDPRLDPIIERCRQLGMPINVHVSDPIWSYQPMDATNDGLMNAYTWRINVVPGVLGHNELIEGFERAVSRHPKNMFVAAHICNLDYDLTRLGQMFDRNPNFHADLGARFGEIGPIPRFGAQFFQKYQDRILWATDTAYTERYLRASFRILETLDEHFYEKELFKYHWPLYGFGLPDAVLKKIYQDNALKVFERARNNAA